MVALIARKACTLKAACLPGEDVMKVVVLGNQGRAVLNFWTVLMRHLLEKGHEVVCAVPAADEEVLTSLSTRCTRLRTYPLSRKGLNPFQDLHTLFALWRLFREEKPDLLFTSTIKPVIYGCLAARAAKVPHIYATITGLGFTFETDSFVKRCIHTLSVFLQRMALRSAEGVFFQNPDDVNVFRTNGIVNEQTRVLMARGTGVDTQHFCEAPFLSPPALGELTFLLVGRLLEAKGLREYAEAAKKVRSLFPRARFQLLGAAEEGLGAVPLDEVLSWQKEGLIDYLGETSDVRPYLSACHVLVLPSWREGTPTSVMEAMSTGRACLVTDVPGCREVVVDGENGRLVPARDPDLLAEAMIFFLKNPQAVSAMGAAGRKRCVTLFDADVVASRILEDMHIV